VSTGEELAGERTEVEAREALYRAVEQNVPRVRCLRRPLVSGDPPFFYVQPPSMTWETYGFGPTEAVYEGVLAVAADENAVDRLLEFLRPITDAIDGAKDVDAAVVSAEPGVWRAGNTELPAYFIRAEAAV
jgi:hypothetical protein